MIDERTRKYYEDLTERSPSHTVAYPQLQARVYLNVGTLPLYSVVRRKAIEYDGTYGEWYRCLAYMIYGYGNLSNNDRRRNGLPVRRKYRRK